ncbi:cell division ATPase MinD [Halovivax asiaticus JCM 14624]|uniref:Cell division ATPase MinD n=1 Tax=Halovivax asiaticus JCM 14624 TaxID=1227490 RepID=M0BGA3_9EURY|nr:MinD/ParA family protein [Halovivax asiaticus]ELZ09477.1 cell division ATPase MinD [Halovivax asiaticus JCM 14624]
MPQETVYAIASGKGGVGKTTTTVNLGTALAQAGEQVAIVDADLGMANLAGFVSLSPGSATLHDVLSGEASIEDATYRLAANIVGVPSGNELADYAETEPDGLGEVVETLRDRVDYVLIDVGAGVSHESVLPLGLADAVVLVATPEPAAVQDVSRTIELVDRVDGEVAGLLVTRTHPSGDVSPETIAEKLGVAELGSIPEDRAVRASVYAGTPLVVHAPESDAAVAYREFATTLTGVESAGPSADDAAADDSSTADSEDTASHGDVSSAITDAEPDA